MVAGIEINETYAQVCVSAAQGAEPETVSLIAGEEQYLIPMEEIWSDREAAGRFIKKLLKYIKNYGNLNTLKVLAVCLWDNDEKKRQFLKEVLAILGISEDKLFFLGAGEAFCAYVMNQTPELSQYQVLLIENRAGRKYYHLLRKSSRRLPCIVEVQEVKEKTLEEIFQERRISSVFLVGEEFERPWLQEHMSSLKQGGRIFSGKNLFSKGTCYRARELQEKRQEYHYLGEDKTRYHIALKTRSNGKEGFETVLEAGRNWYESQVSLEVLLLELPQLELAVMPMYSKVRKVFAVNLLELPKRPKGTTKLAVEFRYLSSEKLQFKVRDLGFGEIFPHSDMMFERILDLQELLEE